MAQRARIIYIPIEIAELLHATLGPLAEVLDGENHHWVPMIRKVLAEYTQQRDKFIRAIHGNISAEIAHHTYLASEKVCGMTELALREEEDFSKWAEEVTGEAETA